MDKLKRTISEWLIDLLVDGIMGNLSGLFDSVNARVGEISQQVGQTPQAWNSSIFEMIQTLSDNVILPIAGLVLAIVMTLELIQLIVDRNNLNDVDSWMFFKWFFKTACAVIIVTNTWSIVMGIFDAAHSVVEHASSTITGETAIDLAALESMEERLKEMELGALFVLWFQTLFVNLAVWILSICIFIVTFGRMLEIYMIASLAPLPMATMLNHNWGNMGQNYLRSLFALAFQAFLMIVCVAIYAVLIEHIAIDEDIGKAIWTSLGYTVLLCFTLFKTGSLSKSLFAAH